jgi:hypothetical protein
MPNNPNPSAVVFAKEIDRMVAITIETRHGLLTRTQWSGLATHSTAVR